MKYQWNKIYQTIDSAETEKFYQTCRNKNIPLKKNQIVLLMSRGITSCSDAVKFLKQYHTFSPDDFFNPLLLPDMPKALNRLKKAYDSQEGILIFGDYDADGITSTALLYRFFRQYFPKSPLFFYQPSRFNEGYGFNKEGVDFALQKNLSLIITVDCGITSHEAVSYAKTKGLDVIVTDHHEAPADLPEALALIDAKRKDADLPFREWAGVGIAFNLVLGFALSYPEICPDFKMAPYLEIASIGTIADIVPVIDENRTIVKAGFFILDKPFQNQQGINPGLYQLRESAKLLNSSIQSYTVSFGIAPRLNAASRMEEARIATTLLISENKEETEKLAKKLNMLNEARKKKQDELFKEVEDYYKNHPEELQAHILFYAEEDVDEGVRGIVASKVVNKFHRPAVILSVDKKEGTISGSGRSVPNINLHHFLSQFSEWFSSWGGHSQAVGLSIELKKFEEFKKTAVQKSLEEFSEKDLAPAVSVDTIIYPEDLTEAYINFVEQLEPFGAGNPKPNFLLQNMKILKISIYTFPSKTSSQMKKRLVFFLESSDGLFKVNLTMWSPEEFFDIKDVTESYLSSYAYKTADFVITLGSSVSNGKKYLNYTIVDFAIKD